MERDREGTEGREGREVGRGLNKDPRREKIICIGLLMTFFFKEDGMCE